MLVFFDDILVYSHSWEEHLQHLTMVLELLEEHQLYAKLSNRQFGQRQIEYLGHIISYEAVATDPPKIKSMINWPKRVSVKALRGFLGLTGYYRKFVKNYGDISRPLTKLLKKDGFNWNNEVDRAFEALKRAMTTTPILALPNFSEPFIVERDASGSGISAMLMQHHRPIAYMSKVLCPRNQGLSIYEREFLALLMAVQKWKHYLQGSHFIIRTDQQSLKFLLEQKVNTTLQKNGLLSCWDWIMKYNIREG